MSKGKRSDVSAAMFFLAPNFLGFMAFVAFPVVFSISMAFTNWDLSLHNRFRPDQALQFIGLRNFTDLFSHPDFWTYLGNTVFLMLAIPLSVAGSLGLALLLVKPLAAQRPDFKWGLAITSVISFVAVGVYLYAVGYGVIALVFCLLAAGVLVLGFTTGATVYRTLFYLPSFTSGVAVYLLWKQLYNPLHGPINRNLQPLLDALTRGVQSSPPWLWQGLGWVLWLIAAVGLVFYAAIVLKNWAQREFGFGTVLMSTMALTAASLILYGLGLVSMRLPLWAAGGLDAPNWLTSVGWAKPAIMFMSLWMGVGSNDMLLYIAGLSNVPPELYEAADIDGASSWQRFWHVTWPQLAPTTFFIIVMAFIGGLQGGFEMARTMTQGGPYGATTTLSYFIYTEGFETGRLGYASAVAWTMFLMIFGLTMFNYKFGSRYVND